MKQCTDIDLVIFDCDGVLIDSEIIACRVDAEELTALGIPMTTEEVIVRFAGMSQKDMWSAVERDIGRPLPDGFAARIAALAEAAMVTELQAIPGVREAVPRLPVPFCVASSSTQEKLRFTLTLTGLYDLCAPNIFSSSEVARGKPAPDLFLRAAERMEATPGRCVVIEDSTTGIEAAVAAGMCPIGFTGGSHCGSGHGDRLRAAGAEIVIDSFEKLVPVLSNRPALPGSREERG